MLAVVLKYWAKVILVFPCPIKLLSWIVCSLPIVVSVRYSGAWLLSITDVCVDVNSFSAAAIPTCITSTT